MRNDLTSTAETTVYTPTHPRYVHSYSSSIVAAQFILSATLLESERGYFFIRTTTSCLLRQEPRMTRNQREIIEWYDLGHR